MTEKRIWFTPSWDYAVMYVVRPNVLRNLRLAAVWYDREAADYVVEWEHENTDGHSAEDLRTSVDWQIKRMREMAAEAIAARFDNT
jgi:hypothetical protein